jgi:hypothetical protein
MSTINAGEVNRAFYDPSRLRVRLAIRDTAHCSRCARLVVLWRPIGILHSFEVKCAKPDREECGQIVHRLGNQADRARQLDANRWAHVRARFDELQAAQTRPVPCPRPDKVPWSTPQQARQARVDLRDNHPLDDTSRLRAYLCECRSWHVGNHAKD